jgi:tetratricopeptide (TPR) repeat protein
MEPHRYVGSANHARRVRALLLLAALFFTGSLRAESLDALNRQGERLLNKGLYAQAIASFNKAIEIGTKSEGPKGANVLRVRQNLARTYGMDGQFALADQNFKESFDGLNEALQAGRGRVTADEVGWVLVNWASVSYSLAQFATAEERVLDAVKMFEDHGLSDSADQARHNLASIYCEEKKYQKAIDTYDAVLDYRERRYGRRDWRYRSALAGPAVVFLKTKDYARAEKFFRSCLDGQVRDGDPETSENLAYTLVAIGQLDEARRIYEHLMDLAEHRFGLPYRVADFKGRLATIAAYQDEWDKALRLADECERFVIPYRRNVAMGLSDSELLSYLNLLGGADDAISIGWARHTERGVAEMALNWSINERGLIYESMAERTLLARDSRLSGGQSELFAELTAVRREYSSQIQAGHGAKPQKEYIAEMSKLMEREADLTHRIGLASLRVPPLRKFVEIASLRRNLDADTVLVHFAKTELRDFAVKGGQQGPKIESHYLAWIVPPNGKGEISMLDIGPVADVEEAMKRTEANFKEREKVVNEFYGQIGKMLKEKLPAAEQDKREKEIFAAMHEREAVVEKAYREDAAQDISKLLLHPLLPAAGSFKKWILCPDADLWLLPWNALVLPDGKYFIEEHTLSHVVTPRDLAAPPAAAHAEPGPPLVMSAPNYDLGVTGPENRAQDVDYLYGFGRVWIDKFLPDLEFFARAKARVFTGDAATEDVIKRTGSPRVLFLATHGSFGKIDPAKMPPGYGFLRESPLVRCLLYFAGCNRKRAPDDTGEDGFLFGSEVLGCDLRGTELVILTACQTAQGDVHAGQSAAGMKQAFQLAGARDVAATLWSVDREASKKLVKNFIAHLAETLPTIEALRQAQLERLGDIATRHPYYWAAFTITGRGH